VTARHRTLALSVYPPRRKPDDEAATTIPTVRMVSTRAPEAATLLQEQIRRRAYELYKQHGSNDGHDLDDWLQAECEVTRLKAKAVTA